MSFKMSNVKDFIDSVVCRRKTNKRNVVYKIGYDRVSLKKAVRTVRNYISNPNTKRKFKDVVIAVRNLFTK